MDIFDSLGVFVGMGYRVGLLDRNLRLHTLSRALLSAAGATGGGTCFGAPTITVHAESAVGVMEEGRTGMTALVVWVLFLLQYLCDAPRCSLMPSAATASTMIVLGAMMMMPMQYIKTRT
jgi:AGZA family xanthine/uracil permease-like MFS transporter